MHRVQTAVTPWRRINRGWAASTAALALAAAGCVHTAQASSPVHAAAGGVVAPLMESPGHSTHTPSLPPRPHPSSLRIIHATDIHFLETPSLAEVAAAPKRLVGITHLWGLRRVDKFSRDVQMQLISTIRQLQPDLVVVSGDTTTLALESEFRTARLALQPLLDNGGQFPTLILAGNHDAYSQSAVDGQLLRRYFGPWMQRLGDGSERALDSEVEPWQWATSANPKAFRQQVQRVQRHFEQFDPRETSAESGRVASLPDVPVFSLGFLRLMCLDPCRPTVLGSRGWYPPQQLAQLGQLLQRAPQPLPDQTTPWQQQQQAGGSSTHSKPVPPLSAFHFLLSHYPLLDGQGRGYEEHHWWHGVKNGGELRALLQRPDNRVWPNIFLHGHVHEGYADRINLAASTTTAANAAGGASTLPPKQLVSFNPGSSGHSFSAKKHRAASFNVYTITPLGTAAVSGAPAPPPSTGALMFQQTAADGTAYQVAVERWQHDGQHFRPETGGPYTSTLSML